MASRRRGPGPSSVLITPDCAGNVVGVDPHKRTVSASGADPRGGIGATEHFRVAGDGHRALEVWAGQFGPIARWGVEGASSWGRHTAIFLIARGYDVRDVCAHRTPRVAREPLANPLLPKAFKRAGQDRGPDEHHELLALRHNQRRSILTSRQHLINEAEHLLSSLPLEPREQLPDSTAVRPRLTALAHRNRRRRYDRPTALRLTLLDDYRTQIARLDDEDQQVTRELAVLVRASGSTLGALCGLSTVLVSELL